MKTSYGRRGFTLIELLVVIAIIGILAAIIFPVMNRAQDKARETQCIANQRQIVMATIILAEDQGGVFPSGATVWQDLAIGGKVLRCPKADANNPLSYGYNGWLSGVGTGSVLYPDDTIVIGDADQKSVLLASEWAPRHAGFVVYAYADGHVAKGKATMPTVGTIDLFSSLSYGMIEDNTSAGMGTLSVVEGAVSGAPVGPKTLRGDALANVFWSPMYNINAAMTAPTGPVSAWAFSTYMSGLNLGTGQTAGYNMYGWTVQDTTQAGMDGDIAQFHHHDNVAYATSWFLKGDGKDNIADGDMVDSLQFTHESVTWSDDIGYLNRKGNADDTAGTVYTADEAAGFDAARAGYFADHISFKMLCTGADQLYLDINNGDKVVGPINTYTAEPAKLTVYGADPSVNDWSKPTNVNFFIFAMGEAMYVDFSAPKFSYFAPAARQ